MEKPLTVKEVADTLQVSEETVRIWIRKGIKGLKLPAIDLGRGYRIEKKDLDDFLQKRKINKEDTK